LKRDVFQTYQSVRSMKPGFLIRMKLVEKWDILTLDVVTVQQYSSSRCLSYSTWWYLNVGPKHVVHNKSTYKNWVVNDELCIIVLFVYIRNKMYRHKFFITACSLQNPQIHCRFRQHTPLFLAWAVVLLCLIRAQKCEPVKKKKLLFLALGLNWINSHQTLIQKSKILFPRSCLLSR
jgi:hypothetical protein